MARVARLDGVDRLDRGDGALGRALDGGTLDDARIPRDQPVLECGCAHRVEEPVSLRNGRRARMARLDEPRSPGPHGPRREVTQLDLVERGQDVELQQAAVVLLRPRPELGAGGEPSLRIVGQRDLAGFRVDPVAALEVGAGGGQPAVGETLRAERLRSGPLDALDLVARLPASGRQLAGVPPRSTGHKEERSANRVARMWHARRFGWLSTPYGSSESGI